MSCRFEASRRYSPFAVLALLLALVASPPPAAAQGGGDPSAEDLYKKADSWAETMLESRKALVEWESQASTFKPHFSKVFHKGDKAERLIVDIDGVNDLWLITTGAGDGITQDHSVWLDGCLIDADGKATPLSEVRSFYRNAGWNTILMDQDYNGAPLQVAGEKFEQGMFAHADSQIGYRLKGEYKRLEVSVGVNDTAGGGSSVRFKVVDRVDAGPHLWQRISTDYPVQAASMASDTPGGAHTIWLRDPSHTDIERDMIRKAAAETGAVAAPMLERLEQLTAEKAKSDDPRWLKTYEDVAMLRQRFRDARAEMELVDFAAVRRAVKDLSETFPDRYPNPDEWLQRVDQAEKTEQSVADALDPEKKLTADAQMEALQKIEGLLAVKREILMTNPLLDFDELLLVNRAGHHGLPQNWQGNCALPRSGYDNEIAVLSPVSSEGEMRTLYRPEGPVFVGDVDLNFDADRMLFSSVGDDSRWHIYEVNVDGTGLRQVTPSSPSVDDYDPCYLPDGRIMYASTSCFQGIPCVGGGNTVANLCLANADGTGIRQVCFDQDHNWCPTVLNNGRVLFARWEYSDTPHYFTRLLMHMNPDGTNQFEYYGSNSFWPNSIFYARPIPNDPTKVIAVISGHHGVPRMGELILFDPAKGRHEADGVVQRIPGWGEEVEPIIRDTLVDGSWPKFLHPYPLSEKYYLVSCMPRPGTTWGIYLVDVFDNMLPLAELPGRMLFEPVPLRRTTRPPLIADRVREDTNEATVYLSDVYAGEGLRGVPRGTVKSLRVYEFHYAYPNMGGHINIGIEGPWDVHRILGTVPVLEDGSAAFKVPSRMPIAVQPLDEEGRALQVMRSWFVAQPGEILSCVGCHERQNTTAPARYTMAARKEPVEITPWYGPTRGFSFVREVQPVLDKYCISCHDGHERKNGMAMLDFRHKDEKGWAGFTESYIALHPYVRRPGPESDYHLQQPLEWGVTTSELFQMLRKGHHGVKMDAESWERLTAWVDLNVPDHGTWTEHREIPADFHERRMETRSENAGRPEDPEVIPPVEVHIGEPEETIEVSAGAGEAGVIAAALTDWPFAAGEAVRRQRSAGDPQSITLDLGEDEDGESVTMELVQVPAGEFLMGCAAETGDERPVAAVKVDEPFFMGVCEVTNQQYSLFDPLHDSRFIDQHHKDHTTPGYPANEKGQPVIRISWQQALEFCDWLSEKTGRSFTLPTEAQWEWACRAGSETPFFYGDGGTDFSAFANLADASISLLAVSGVNPQPIANPNPYQDFVPKDGRFNDGQRIVCAVGGYKPNPWGLKDMHGNVAEWTLSLMKSYPYVAGDGRNALDAEGQRVVRGGSWRDRPYRATASYRLSYEPWQRVFNVGFRVVAPAGASGRKVVLSER